MPALKRAEQVMIYTWKTKSIIQETANSLTIVFDTGAERFGYKAGQFINVTILIHQVRVTRSYSLSSSPVKDRYPSITVKKVAGGIMSNYIVDHAHDIGQWQVDGPFGKFFATEGGHVVLLAGGSGITPLFSIANEVLHNTADTRITLLYASRTTDDIIFRTAIDEWAGLHLDRAQVFYAISGAGTTELPRTGTVIEGRFNKELVKSIINNPADPAAATSYFLCGPVPLMDLFQDTLIEMGIPASSVFLEKFKPESIILEEELPVEMYEVLIHYYEQTHLIEVEPAISILNAALRERIPLSFSCKNGTCGKCIGLLTSGKVHMEHNTVLNQQDLDAGFVLLCQSHPLNEDVTIEIR